MGSVKEPKDKETTKTLQNFDQKRSRVNKQQDSIKESHHIIKETKREEPQYYCARLCYKICQCLCPCFMKYDEIKTVKVLETLDKFQTNKVKSKSDRKTTDSTGTAKERMENDQDGRKDNLKGMKKEHEFVNVGSEVGRKQSQQNIKRKDGKKIETQLPQGKSGRKRKTRRNRANKTSTARSNNKEEKLELKNKQKEHKSVSIKQENGQIEVKELETRVNKPGKKDTIIEKQQQDMGEKDDDDKTKIREEGMSGNRKTQEKTKMAEEKLRAKEEKASRNSKGVISSKQQLHKMQKGSRKKEHSSSDRYICPICNKTSREESKIERHILSVHVKREISNDEMNQVDWTKFGMNEEEQTLEATKHIHFSRSVEQMVRASPQNIIGKEVFATLDLKDRDQIKTKHIQPEKSSEEFRCCEQCKNRFNDVDLANHKDTGTMMCADCSKMKNAIKRGLNRDFEPVNSPRTDNELDNERVVENIIKLPVFCGICESVFIDACTVMRDNLIEVIRGSGKQKKVCYNCKACKEERYVKFDMIKHIYDHCLSKEFVCKACASNEKYF